jgi:gliding motility-associated-like protein
MKKLLLFSVLLFLSTFITAQNNFIKQDTVYGQSSDCVGGVNVCIDSIKFLDAIISGFTFTLDGQVYNPPVPEPCTVDTIYQYTYKEIFDNGERAPIELLPSRINGQLRAQVFPDFNIFLDSLKVWGPSASWFADTLTKDIINYPLNDTFRFLGKVLGRNYDLTGNQGFDYRGLLVKVAPGFHQFIVTDVVNNQRDTVTLRAACIQKDTIRQTVNIGSNAIYTVNTEQLLGTPQSASFVNICAKPITSVNFISLSYPNISFSGVSVGTDTACLKVCDEFGICDTTILIVSAQLAPSRNITYRDSVAIGAARRSACGIFKPLGTTTIYDEFSCGTRQGHINYTIDKVGDCINFTAASLGFDTVCIRVCNSNMVCDTTTFILKALPAVVVTPDTPRFPINDFVNIGTPKANCSIQKPIGTGLVYTIESQSITGNVNFTLDAVGGCVNFTGTTVGQDSIRILTCNSTNSCVRTIFYVNAQVAVDTPRFPISNFVVIGTPKTVNNIQKPTGTGLTYTIESQSTAGNVSFALDAVAGTVTFTGLAVGQDSVRILTCSSTSGLCVRTTFYVNAQNPVAAPQGTRTVFFDSVTINTGAKSRNDIVKPSAPLNFFRIVAQSTGKVVFNLDTVTSIINFTGVALGTDSVSIRVCNVAGTCDTTVYFVTVQVADTPRTVINKTVTIGTPLTSSDIVKPATGTIAPYAIESQSSTGHASFLLDNVAGTMTFTGLAVGTDSVRVLVCTTLGQCVRTVYYVNVIAAPDTPVTRFNKTVIIGTLLPSCDIKIPTIGTPAPYTIESQSTTGHVTATVDNVGNCINFTGLTVGQDSFRILVCNTLGTSCVRTVYTVTAQAPVVVPQGTRTTRNDVVTIGAGAKTRTDIVKPTGTINSFKIIGQSTLGHVTFVLDTIASTISFTGLTVGTDSARVIVCNTLGTCDTTTYFVTAQAPVVVTQGTRTQRNDVVTIGAGAKTRTDIVKPTGTINSFKIIGQSTLGHVTFVLDTIASTISFTGLTVGTDSARVIVCNTLGTCDTTTYFVTAQAPIVVTQGTRTTRNDVVTIGAGAKTRTDIVKPTGTINSFKIIGQSTLGHVTFVLDTIASTISFTGLTVGTDSARVIVCNTIGTCDTTTYFVTAQTQALVGRKTTFQDSVIIGQPAKTRNDVLIPTGTVATIKDICSYARTHVQFNIDQINNRVSFFGLNPAGIDSICIQVCNTAGLCDTSIYDVKSIAVVTNYKPGKVTYVDSVAITGLPRQRCDLRLPPGNIISFDNISPINTSPRVQFTIDAVTNCVIFKGLAPGVETGSFKVCNSLGQCDTTIYVIRSRATITPKISGTFIIKDTITEGATRTRGDLEVPDGAIIFFANICPNNSGNEVFFAIDPTLKTITYQGVKAGFDTACIRVCNVNQVCDTTVFIIETKPLLNVGGSRKYFFRDSLIVSGIRSKCDLTQPFNATTIRNLCPTSSGNEIRFDINQTTRCVTYTAVGLGVDTACIEICDGSGLCDTTYMYIKGLKDPTVKPKPSEERFTIMINERLKFCPDTTELAGSPINLIKFCEVTNYDNVDITFLGDDPIKCVLIDGKSAGKDTFCISVQNQSGFSDTVRIYITVLPDTFRPKIGYDSVSIKIGESIVVCPDSSELFLANITDLRNCTNTTIDNSMMIFNPITKCVELRGTSFGRDTMCVVLCNAKNVCDTTIIYVKVSADTVKPISSTEVITLNLGQTFVFSKIDSSQIFGSVDTTYDACPGSHGTIAQLTLDRIAKTVAIKDKGTAGGPERMCIVVCNKISKLCDTTFLLVTYKDTAVVVPVDIMANNDFVDSVKLGTRNLPIFVYANDTLKGRTPVSLTIVSPPKKGTVDTVSFKAGLLNYSVSRSPNSCGIDTFRYRVCVLNGTDTVCSEATVNVTIICSDLLKVANGFSPNGDRDNEFFFIDGLAAYPDNTVLVYNRWGNEVLKAKNYENNWHGDWKGKDLPDGTYFYLIRDDAKGEVVQTGWVVINR